MSPLLLLVVCFALAALTSTTICRATLSYAVRRRALLDVPNQRSAHSVPTPRGGGLSIAATTLGAIALGWWTGWVGRELAVALLGGGALVAAIGWRDDVRSLPSGVRLVTHFLAAAWALLWLGGLPAVDLSRWTLPMGPLGYPVAALGIVWSINLYNFMDGIDGLAGGEALMVGLGGAVLFLLGGAPALALIPAVAAGSALGFLVWNRPPARIFMGDVGSYFLGFLFPVLAIAGEREGALPLAVWVVLLGVFVFDATVTVCRRALRGEQWYGPHRKHAYQRVALGGWGHARVTGAAMLMNLALVGAAAAVVMAGLDPAYVVLTVALALALLYGVIEKRWPMAPKEPGASAMTRAGGP